MARGLSGNFGDLAARSDLPASFHFYQSYDRYGNYNPVSATATDNWRNNGDLPITSVARESRRGGGQASRAFGAHDYLAQMGVDHPASQGSISAAALGAEQVNRALQGNYATNNDANVGTQSIDAAYDTGRIRAEMAELDSRYRDYGGLDKVDPHAGMPIQTIYGKDGSILMQGHAFSPEHLIAQKLQEAERTSDPAKKVVNLAGADLQGLNFKGFNFSNVDMRGANLSGSTFQECKLENCDMEGANLKGTVIDKCMMRNVCLNGFEGDNKTVFKNSALENVHMAGAVAPGIRFEHIRAEQLNIAGAQMPGSTWTDVQVNNLWGKDAQLQNSRFGGVHIAGAHSSLENADLSGPNTSLYNCSFGAPNQPINMRGVKLAYATLQDVTITGDVSGIDISNTVMRSGVDLRNAKTPLGPMIAEGAHLEGLTAGKDCRISTSRFTMGSPDNPVHITSASGYPIVFEGTDDIKRLGRIAMSNGLKHMEMDQSGNAIDPATGEMIGEKIAAAAGATPVQRRRAPMPMMAMGPRIPGSIGTSH